MGQIDGLSDQSILDVRKLTTGKDGQLFVTSKAGNNIFLAECDTYQCSVSVNNVDYQPVGSALVYAVNTGYTVSISLTEAVVRDNIMIVEFIDDVRKGYFPPFDFQGKLRRRDGQMERMVFRNCVPDGTIDLMNLTPGEIIKRQWNFRVNASPEMLQKFEDVEWNPIE